MAEINNLHEFAMPIGEVNNDYNTKQAEMLKDLMSQMDVLLSVSIGESCEVTSYWLCWIKARR